MEFLKFARLCISLKSMQNNTEPVCLSALFVYLFLFFLLLLLFICCGDSMIYGNSRKLKNSGFGWKTFLPLQERRTSQSIIIFTIPTSWLDLQCSGGILSLRYRELVPGLLCSILSSDYPYSLLLDVQKEK